MGWIKKLKMLLFALLLPVLAMSDDHQPLSKIAIHETVFAIDEHAYIKATPNVLGSRVSILLDL